MRFSQRSRRTVGELEPQQLERSSSNASPVTLTKRVVANVDPDSREGQAMLKEAEDRMAAEMETQQAYEQGFAELVDDVQDSTGFL